MTAAARNIESAPPMPNGPIGGAAAWRGPAIAQSREWLIEFTPQELIEIDQAIHQHVADGRGMDEISPETFQLPTLGARLGEALNQTLSGCGFVLLRGFPVENYSLPEAAIGYLGIGSYFGKFRSQNAKGHLLGHVRNIGKDISNPTTRFYETNRALKYHTDSADIVALLCLKTAKQGGASRIVSSVTLHDEILKRRPDLWRVLFNDFPTDRRGEVPPGMQPWFDVPVFNWYEGQLTTIYVGQYIRSAQKNCPEARRLSPLELEALDYLDTLCNDPQLNLTMDFRPGDMQFLSNHQVLHSRTDFEDWEEAERKRHLLRLWLSPSDGRPLPPSFAARYGSLTPGDRGGIITESTVLKFTLQAE